MRRSMMMCASLLLGLALASDGMSATGGSSGFSRPVRPVPSQASTPAASPPATVPPQETPPVVPTSPQDIQPGPSMPPAAPLEVSAPPAVTPPPSVVPQPSLPPVAPPQVLAPPQNPFQNVQPQPDPLVNQPLPQPAAQPSLPLPSTSAQPSTGTERTSPLRTMSYMESRRRASTSTRTRQDYRSLGNLLPTDPRAFPAVHGPEPGSAVMYPQRSMGNLPLSIAPGSTGGYQGVYPRRSMGNMPAFVTPGASVPSQPIQRRSMGNLRPPTPVP